jgi:hypothetical protein
VWPQLLYIKDGSAIRRPVYCTHVPACTYISNSQRHLRVDGSVLELSGCVFYRLTEELVHRGGMIVNKQAGCVRAKGG